jgi:hypothetical protein
MAKKILEFRISFPKNIAVGNFNATHSLTHNNNFLEI